MSSWPLVALGDIFEIARGGSPRPIANYVTEELDGVNWIMISDASAGSKYITRTKKRIRTEGVKRSRMVHPGDFLLTNSMSFGRPYILRTSGCIHDGWLVLGKKGDGVDQDFFFHLLESKAVFTEFARLAAGATVKNLNIEVVKGVKVSLPPLPEQRRIAEVLDRAEALRAKRRAALAQLDALTQAIFLDMFGDPATNPKGWPRRLIGQVGKVVTGNTPPRAKPDYFGTDIEWIKSDNINTPHYYLTRAHEGLSQAGKAVARTVPAYSILVTCIAGSLDCIGNAAMTNREVAFNQQINALIPQHGDPHFLYAQIRVGKRLIQRASTGGMKGMVSKSRFERILLAFPPLDLQRDFSRRVATVEKLKAAYRTSLAGLDALFASLQHRAFRGEL